MNEQPTEQSTWDEAGRLEVFNVWETIQGEGPFVGAPAIFIRLAGCNLRCDWCDTDYTSRRKLMTVDELLPIIDGMGHDSTRLIVITGGEPLRQNVEPLICRLLFSDCGYTVQIETNGTLQPPLTCWSSMTVVCSPKTPKIKLQHVNDWKYVLKAGQVAEDGLPIGLARPTNDGQVWVQPMDEKTPDLNERNIRVAVESCLQHGYRLSIQTHKLVGVE